MQTYISQNLILRWLTIICLLISSPLLSQPGNKKRPPHPPASCEGNCFSTAVTKAIVNDRGCIEYELTVSHDGTCRYDLSHVTIEVPCGDIVDLENSRNWKQEIGKDPTTGIKGFKIDDIPSFGKDSDTSFTIKVTICSADSVCLEPLTRVGYKAGQCIDYDTLNYKIDNGGSGEDTTKTCTRLLASLAAINVTCPGLANGKLRTIIAEGKAPFLYRWSTGAVDSALQNLSAGDYSVTIIDADKNTVTLHQVITQPDDIVISESVAHPTCNGSLTGGIDLSVSGGNEPYTFAWSNGATSEDLVNVSAGSYRVTVTDRNSCSNQKLITLVNQSAIALSAVVTKTACGQATGAIDLTAVGGSQPYTFVWSNGATTEDIQNSGAGSYRVTVTDANGCRTQGIYSITENSTVKVVFIVTPAGCLNEASGAIDLTVSGGMAPYIYQWHHGPITEDVTALVSGVYRVTVTDNNGCSQIVSVSVSKKLIQLTSQVKQPLCSGDSTGSISVTPINSDSELYTYVWSTGDTTQTIAGLAPGSYTVTITDSEGCSRTLSYAITQPAALTLSSVISNSQCGEQGAFAIDLTVAGGRSPYTYLWSTGATTQDVSNLTTGTYEVDVSDVNGCSTTREITVSGGPEDWSCVIVPPADMPVCNSAGNTLSASVSDAQNYQWAVSSVDNSWTITAGATNSAIVYTSGKPGTTATFSLTLEKDGCLQTCSYTITGACEERDNTGGGNPSEDDPCDTVEEEPEDEGRVEAEKQPEETTKEEGLPSISAFPNPFEDKVTFTWVANQDDIVRLEVLDPMGHSMTDVYRGNVRKGQKYSFEWTAIGLQGRLYFFKYTSSAKSVVRKLMHE